VSSYFSFWDDEKRSFLILNGRNKFKTIFQKKQAIETVQSFVNYCEFLIIVRDNHICFKIIIF